MQAADGLLNPTLNNAGNMQYQGTLYSDMEVEDESTKMATVTMCGLRAPNPAPDIEIITPRIKIKQKIIYDINEFDNHIIDIKKKKYAKEAWPGKKPLKS